MPREYPDQAGDVVVNFAYNTASNLLRYPGLHDATVSATIAASQRWTCPFNGSVVEIGIISYTSAGSTTIGVHKDLNATPEETDTQTPPTTSPAGESPFTSNTFLKGEVLSVSVDPTNAIGNVTGYFKFRPN